jgi:hypothetical protein
MQANQICISTKQTNGEEKSSHLQVSAVYMKTNGAIDLSVTKEVPSNTNVDKLLNSSDGIAAVCLGGEKLGTACVEHDTWN